VSGNNYFEVFCEKSASLKQVICVGSSYRNSLSDSVFSDNHCMNLWGP